MYFEWGWKPRTTVAERRRQADRETSKLQKKGRDLAPLGHVRVAAHDRHGAGRVGRDSNPGGAVGHPLVAADLRSDARTALPSAKPQWHGNRPSRDLTQTLIGVAAGTSINRSRRAHV